MIAEAFHHEEIRKSQCSVFVTVREGFGTGLWINGEIFRGPSYTAGEFGHTSLIYTVVKMSLGNTGCLRVLSLYLHSSENLLVNGQIHQ